MLPRNKQSFPSRIYRFFLHLLPFDFQRDYGADMEDVFQQESETIKQKRGTASISLWLRTMRGITRTAVSEHLDSFYRDARVGVRTLLKNPGFTAVAVTMLALGIGVNTAVFTVTNAALFKGFPLVKQNDRVLYITNSSVPYPDFVDWRAQAKSFSGMAAAQGLFKYVGGSSDAPEIYSGSPVTVNSFQVLGVAPRLGRDFTMADGEPGAAPVTILSYDLWEHGFAKDPTVLGRSIQLNGVPTNVIGVMPAGFYFPQKQDLWVPIIPTPNVLRRDRPFLMLALGRMADGTTIEGARAEMQTIGHRLESDYPRTNHSIPAVKDFNEMFIGSNATALYKAMWGGVSFVLLIACANVANLLLSRAIGRSREISLRIAVGAGRGRIIQQLLVESLLLSSVGGGLGWWIAETGVHLYILIQRSDSWFAHLLGYAMDYHVFIYLITISIGTGFLFGLAPALRLSRIDVNSALKDGGHGGTGGQAGKRLSAMLIAGEVALAVVLLAGAGVMIRSFLNIYNANVGVSTENILAAYVYLPADRYPDGEAQISFFDRLKSHLEALPGVKSVAAGPAPTETVGRSPYEIADGPPVDDRSRPLALASAVSPGYFQTLGTTVLLGRGFNDFDRPSNLPVVIVNERFATRNWPGDNPLGKHLRLFRDDQPQPWLTVVGVVSNVVQDDPARQQFDPMVYQPFQQRPTGGMGILVRTGVPPASLITSIQRELHAVDSLLPFQHLAPLTAWMSVVGGVYELNRNIAILFLVFGATALLLASVGLYSLVAQSVSQRIQEIGIRTALGATARDIRSLVFKQGMMPLVLGLTLGLSLSFAVNHVLKSQLVGVSPADPFALVVSSALLVLCAALGCWIPARRAMRVDPAVALRQE